jgi:hypothetical protein
MRRLTFLLCGCAAGLATVTACGSGTTTGTAAPQQQAHQVRTVADLSSLMSSSTSNVHTAHMRFDASTSQGDITGAGQIDIDGVNSKLQMNVNIPSVGAMDMELIGSTMYMELPKGLVQTQQPWIKFDPRGTDPVSKALAGIVSQEQQSTNPVQAISQLTDAGTITSKSSDTLNGASTTRYMIRVDTKKLLNSKAITPQLKQQLSSVAGSLPPTMDYMMWLNSQNLPVKLTTSETIANQPINVTVTYSDWGQPVTITPPPADQVGPLPTR